VSEQYRVLAGRIHRELEELGRVVTRAERALEAARQRPEDQDLYLDSVPQVRPAVLSAQTVQDLEEYLGFRHVVRHIYAFEFDFERVERLVRHLRPLFERVNTELKAFANLLERLSQ
jgi:hypothetical protein